MIISQNGAVDLIPEYNRALRPIFCVSEGDANSRTINLTVTSAGEVFNIPEGAEVYVAGKKQDNTIFTYQCAFSGYIVSFPIAEQMSAANGLVLCELQIVVAGDPLGSANFCYWVEPSPIANGSSSESDLNIFEQAIAALGGYEYLTSEVSVLSARMDQFARLPDGSLSTAADAELVDIRVQADGSTASTAGDAVRAQVADIKNNISDVLDCTIDAPYSATVNVINGGLNAVGANYNFPNNTRVRTTYIALTTDDLYCVDVTNTEYAIERAFVYATSTQGSMIKEIPLANRHMLCFKAEGAIKYFRCSFVHSADVTVSMTDADIAAILSSLEIRVLTDKSLSVSGVPADSKTSGQLLKGLVDVNSFEVENWEIGAIRATNGENLASTNRYRTVGFTNGASLFANGEIVISIEKGFRLLNILAYDAPDLSDTSHYKGGILTNNTWNITGSYALALEDSELADVNYYYRFVVAKEDDSTIASDFNDPGVLKFIWKKNGKSGTVRDNTYGTFNIVRFTVNINTAPYGQPASYNDVLCILQLPSSYTPTGKKTPLIMAGHGAHGYIGPNIWNNTNFRNMVDNISSYGYAVFDVNNIGNNSGGSADEGNLMLMEAYCEAWKYIKDNYNVEDELYILSNSMGTFAAFNMLKWYGAKIKTAILTGARVSIGYIYANADATAQSYIRTVFNWPEGVTDYAEATDIMRPYDEWLNIIEIDSTKYVNRNFPPIKVMVGTADTSQLTEVRQYFEALKASGNLVAYSETEGADHNTMCYLMTEALISDAIDWFERFRNHA